MLLPASPSPPKLTKNNEDVQYLEQLISDVHNNGQVQDRSTVYSRNFRFQKYRKKNFCTCYNNSLYELGADRPWTAGKLNTSHYWNLPFSLLMFYAEMWPTVFDDVKPILSEEGCVKLGVKPRKLDDDGSDVNELDLEGREVLLIENGFFKPLYFVSEWTEALTTRECVAVAIVLPSGVGRDDARKPMYWLEVNDGGCTLELLVKWQSEMTDVRILHTFWLVLQREKKISEHHMKITLISVNLKELCALCALMELISFTVSSTFYFFLPWKAPSNLSFSDGQRQERLSYM